MKKLKIFFFFFKSVIFNIYIYIFILIYDEYIGYILVYILYK